MLTSMYSDLNSLDISVGILISHLFISCIICQEKASCNEIKRAARKVETGLRSKTSLGYAQNLKEMETVTNFLHW